MKNKRRLVSIGTLFIVLAVLLCIAFAVGLSWGSSSRQQKITQDILEQRLQNISELATIEYHYTNMGKFEDRLDFYGWAVPLTKKSFIVSYDGTIKAGIDVSELRSEIRNDRIILTVPAPKILSHEIDFSTLTVYDESRNIFNPISITDYQKFSLDQQAAMEQRVIDAGLLDEAKQRTEQALSQMVLLGLEDAEELDLVIHWLPAQK